MVDSPINKTVENAMVKTIYFLPQENSGAIDEKMPVFFGITAVVLQKKFCNLFYYLSFQFPRTDVSITI